MSPRQARAVAEQRRREQRESTARICDDLLASATTPTSSPLICSSPTTKRLNSMLYPPIPPYTALVASVVPFVVADVYPKAPTVSHPMAVPSWSSMALTTFSTSTNQHPNILKIFHYFPLLPTEIRLKIWRDAINNPRFISLPHLHIFSDSFVAIPSPLLLHVSHEARSEVLKLYAQSETHAIPTLNNRGVKWVRFDQDIIHIKDTNLSSLSAGYTRVGRGAPIDRWLASGRFGYSLQRGDKWVLRPPHFDSIKALAISRDLLVHLPDDYECFIRHFFPNLLVLIVLIDDEIDIDITWRVFDLEYERYEAKWNGRTPRLEFAAACEGPFRAVKTNDDYQMGIEYEMRKRFSREEQDFDEYTAPRIQVMGANVPDGVEVPQCGRYPATPIKVKKDFMDPFADIGGENSSLFTQKMRQSGSENEFDSRAPTKSGDGGQSPCWMRHRGSREVKDAEQV